MIQTKRLLLRPLEVSDSEFIFKLYNDPSFIKNVGDRGVSDLNSAVKIIQTVHQNSYKKNGFGFYAVELKVSGVPIGICGLAKREDLDAPDVGFAFFPPYWGSGFATESSQVILEYAHKRLKLQKVYGFTKLDNEPSKNVLKKLGLVSKGVRNVEGHLNELFVLEF